MPGAAADHLRICHQPQGCQGFGFSVSPSLLARADEVIE
jgi:hypothetical protein